MIGSNSITNKLQVLNDILEFEKTLSIFKLKHDSYIK
jgi:hypothetical protein